jgi:hypothetical protein
MRVSGWRGAGGGHRGIAVGAGRPGHLGPRPGGSGPFSGSSWPRNAARVAAVTSEAMATSPSADEAVLERRADGLYRAIPQANGSSGMCPRRRRWGVLPESHRKRRSCLLVESARWTPLEVGPQYADRSSSRLMETCSPLPTSAVRILRPPAREWFQHPFDIRRRGLRAGSRWCTSPGSSPHAAEAGAELLAGFGRWVSAPGEGLETGAAQFVRPRERVHRGA